MSVAAPLHLSTSDERRALAWTPSRGTLLICWLIAGVSLCFAIGRPPVQRTQEARVLETARQMRGTGLRGWLVPRINGNLRLQKPPLAYWMAAVAYDVAGVGTTSGRIPTALCGWLTLAVTYFAARWLFGPRTAFLTAAALLCSYLFFRHDRLAETDAPSALFVTIAIWAWMRAVDLEGVAIDAAPARSRVQALWFNFGALATVGAILFKGGPGAFPPVFLLGFVALRGKWNALWNFVKSGAPFLLIVLAYPWFYYAQHSTNSGQITGEVDTLLSGQDHYAPFWHYGPELLKATLPWTFITVGAVFVALAPLVSRRDGGRSFGSRFESWRSMPEAATLVWAVAILLPLCVIGNKQFHYLLPLMPPVMILVGWLLDLATRDATPRASPLVAAVIDGTLLGTLVAVPGVPAAAHRVLGHVRPADWALAAAILVAVAVVAFAYVRNGRRGAILSYLACCTLIFPAAVGLWMPLMEPDDSSAVARQIAARYHAGPYAFYGPNYSLPLCFNLRAAIPSLKKPEALREAIAENPKLIVIAQSKSKYPAPVPPPGFELEMRIKTASQVFEIYRWRPGTSGKGSSGGIAWITSVSVKRE